MLKELKTELYKKVSKHCEIDKCFVFLISEIGEDVDKRNYIVSNEKIEKAGFTASRSVDQGVKELIKSMPLLKKNQFANI